LLPSTRDPKLWQVRVKKNFEKIAVMAILNKCIDFASRGRPLSILSVTSSDSTEGYIFVEAFKEIHVKEACAQLHFVFN
jgi:transcription elongation factor SPT5